MSIKLKNPRWLKILSRVNCPGFAYGEHTADVLVIVKARSLEELFEVAAKAVYELMTDTSKVEPKINININEEGLDLYNLLYRYIEGLLYYTDSERLVFSRFKVYKIVHQAEDVWKVYSEAWGEQFNPERHEHRTMVKAMTYAQMKIMKESEECYLATFVPDI